MSKVHWLPRTKLGKISIWLAICGIALFYFQYWLGMLFPSPDQPIGIDLLIRILPGFTAIFAIITGGVTSIISIIKRKDRAIFLFISALMGFLGLLVLLGEFLIPH